MAASPPITAPAEVDVAVIGAGFGGLGAALHAAESGASVAIFESLSYPGGCASSFRRGNATYEAGATLFCGLGPDQPFGRWRRRHGLDVDFSILKTPVELRAPDLRLPVHSDKAAFVDQLCGLQGAPKEGIRRFFDIQGRVADVLWPVLDDAGRLPPMTTAGLGYHATRLWRYPALARWMGRPALALATECGVADFHPLRIWMDAICQITVQTSVREAEAPFALSTMDYCFREAGHVHGGIGQLAKALLQTIGQLGGQIYMPNRVRRLRRSHGGWTVSHRTGELHARAVISNLLPSALDQLLLDTERRPLTELVAQEAESWGAATLFMQVDPSCGLPESPTHLELVSNPDNPFTEGNHVFCSISGTSETRAPEGRRTATVSTHVDLRALQSKGREAQGEHISSVQRKMQRTIEGQAPELSRAIVHLETASPRTYERFTRRTMGRVGGVPRTVGLHHYTGIIPSPLDAHLWTVGDAVFPGQSTLAASIGGVRTARAALGDL